MEIIFLAVNLVLPIVSVSLSCKGYGSNHKKNAA